MLWFVCRNHFYYRSLSPLGDHAHYVERHLTFPPNVRFEAKVS